MTCGLWSYLPLQGLHGTRNSRYCTTCTTEVRTTKGRRKQAIILLPCFLCFVVLSSTCLHGIPGIQILRIIKARKQVELPPPAFKFPSDTCTQMQEASRTSLTFPSPPPNQVFMFSPDRSGHSHHSDTSTHIKTT